MKPTSIPLGLDQARALVGPDKDLADAVKRYLRTQLEEIDGPPPCGHPSKAILGFTPEFTCVAPRGHDGDHVAPPGVWA